MGLASLAFMACLYLGPTVLIFLSKSKLKRGTKGAWVLAAVSPLVLAPIGAYLYLLAHPSAQVHIHSQVLITPVMASLFAVWGVFVLYRGIGVGNDA